MARELKHIDVTKLPELLQLAREVQRTRQPSVLRGDSEDLAILVPVAAPVRSAPARRGTRPATPRRATLESTAASLDPPTRTEDLDEIIRQAKEEHAERTRAKLQRQ